MKLFIDIFLISMFCHEVSWAIVDENDNGLSDVWERKHDEVGASSLSETDGDGQNNFFESLAGTNPNDNQSFLRITNVQIWISSSFISWKSELGNKYQLEKFSSLASGTWLAVGSVIQGNGEIMILANDIGTEAGMFYRINKLDGVSEHSSIIMEALQNFTYDTDGDGKSDADEISQGLDPFVAQMDFQTPRIETGDGISITWPTEAGKYYQLKSRLFGSQNAWQDEGSVHVGGGSDITTTIIGLNALFNEYEVECFDMDSDGDGVTDWEELQVGLDPQVAKTDTLGPGDLMVLQALLASTNKISINASNAVANVTQMEDGGVEVLREGGVDELIINYSITGTAIPNSDYSTLSGTILIPFGKNSGVIPVKPLGSSQMTLSESVILTLQGSKDYSLTTRFSQQVNVIKEVALDVKNYGAVGDGVADDTVAVQNAINALEIPTTPTIRFIFQRVPMF